AVQGFRACIPSDEVPIRQLTDVVKKWLEDHPAVRHYPARGLVAQALSEVFPCKAAKQRLPAVPTSVGTPRNLSGAEIQRLSASGASVLADTVIVDSKATGGFGFHPEEPPPAGGTPMVSGFVFEAPSTVVITATGTIDLYPNVLELEGISPDGYEVWGSLWDLGRSQIGYTPLEEASVDGGADFNSFPDAMLHTGALMGAFVPNSTVASPGFSPKDEDFGVPAIRSDQLFFIGSGPFEFKATEPGTLFLGVNDGRASNNRWSFKVKVRFAN
ncbi:MAG: Rap1a/Tai family immunity protein, partial [Alphaproteobacteria bacterium]|nr:Rap1a/Tai family immunity protein [Alphaproteobacteria bacterium]